MEHRARPKRNLRPADLGTFLTAWWMMLFIDVSLRLFPYHRVSQWTRAVSIQRQKKHSLGTQEVISRICWVASAARRRHALRITCLRYTLTLQWLLARAGIPAQVKFGVRKSDGQFQAHAWLEYQGAPIGISEKLEKEYTQLVFHPPSNERPFFKSE